MVQLNYRICVLTLNVKVKSKLHLLLDNFSSKEPDLKKLQKIFKGTQTAGNEFIKPGLQIATPLISAAFAAKTKNPQTAQTRTNILKSISGRKVLSLTDMHGHGLRSKAM